MAGASPYARKVRVFAGERGLADRIEPILVNPHERPGALVDANPLSKVPTLIDDDGLAHADSLAICLYLDTLGDVAPLIPSSGPARWAVLERHMLANGVMECSVARRMESLLPAEAGRAAGMEKQAVTTRRVLDRFEQTIEEFGEEAGLDTTALACALAYLDFRFPDEGWREGRQRLATWHEAFERRAALKNAPFH